jgi:hypothetical protein
MRTVGLADVAAERLGAVLVLTINRLQVGNARDPGIDGVITPISSPPHSAPISTPWSPLAVRNISRLVQTSIVLSDIRKQAILFENAQSFQELRSRRGGDATAELPFHETLAFHLWLENGDAR